MSTIMSMGAKMLSFPEKLLRGYHDFWDAGSKGTKAYTVTAMIGLGFAFKAMTNRGISLPLTPTGFSSNESIAFHCFLAFVGLTSVAGAIRNAYKA